MPVQTQRSKFTAAEYLEWEQCSQVRHEYLAGEVYVMAGASEAHNLITGNMYLQLRTYLRGSSCRVFASDMKVRVEVLDTFYYPDVFVTCDSQDQDKFFKTRPCLIVEVTSPSTERIDRHEKHLAYQRLDSLQEYVIISQDEVRVEVYRKDEQGVWQLETLGNEDELDLATVGLKLAIAQVYQDVQIPA